MNKETAIYLNPNSFVVAVCAVKEEPIQWMNRYCQSMNQFLERIRFLVPTAQEIISNVKT